MEFRKVFVNTLYDKVSYSAESATFDITHLSAAVTIVNRETSSEKTEVTEITN